MDISKVKVVPVFWTLMDKKRKLILRGIKPRTFYHVDEPFVAGQVLYRSEHLALNALYKVSSCSDLANKFFKEQYGVNFWEITHRDHWKYFDPVSVFVDYI